MYVTSVDKWCRNHNGITRMNQSIVKDKYDGTDIFKGKDSYVFTTVFSEEFKFTVENTTKKLRVEVEHINHLIGSSDVKDLIDRDTNMLVRAPTVGKWDKTAVFVVSLTYGNGEVEYMSLNPNGLLHVLRSQYLKISDTSDYFIDDFVSVLNRWCAQHSGVERNVTESSKQKLFRRTEYKDHLISCRMEEIDFRINSGIAKLKIDVSHDDYLDATSDKNKLLTSTHTKDWNYAMPWSVSAELIYDGRVIETLNWQGNGHRALRKLNNFLQAIRPDPAPVETVTVGSEWKDILQLCDRLTCGF